MKCRLTVNLFLMELILRCARIILFKFDLRKAPNISLKGLKSLSKADSPKTELVLGFLVFPILLLSFPFLLLFLTIWLCVLLFQLGNKPLIASVKTSINFVAPFKFKWTLLLLRCLLGLIAFELFI